MTRIAISYRRDDSAGITGRIFDRLVAHYGGDSVFRDIDNIPLGVDFREHINTVLAQTDVTLVVVGKRWFGPQPRRRRRIDDPADPVRVEVETALRNRMPVVPVLVEDAAMPNVDQLPDSLKDLVYRNGLQVDAGRDFEQHIERLIRNLEPILARRAEEQTEAARQADEEGQRVEAAQQVEDERQRAEAARQAEEERQRADAAWQAEEEKQRAEAARGAEEEKQRVEAGRQAEEERQRAEAARLGEEERQRAKAARQAEEETRRLEAAWQAEEEKRRAEAARQAEEESHRAEVARQAEEERQRIEAARQAEQEERRAEKEQGSEDIAASGYRGIILPPHLSRRWLAIGAGVLIAVTVAGGGYALYLTQQHALQNVALENRSAEVAVREAQEGRRRAEEAMRQTEEVRQHAGATQKAPGLTENATSAQLPGAPTSRVSVPAQEVSGAEALRKANEALNNKDNPEAIRWFRTAAGQGNATAQSWLGSLYHYDGFGVTQDFGEALRWYRKAADQGDARAQYEIGILYWNGLGVPRDLGQARAWIQKASAGGFEDAKNWLARH